MWKGVTHPTPPWLAVRLLSMRASYPPGGAPSPPPPFLPPAPLLPADPKRSCSSQSGAPLAAPPTPLPLPAPPAPDTSLKMCTVSVSELTHRSVLAALNAMLKMRAG